MIDENIRCRHSGRGPWSSKRNLKRCSTWRIIPFSRWLITMVSFRPPSRDVPLPSGRFMAYKWGLLTSYIHWDDPPSSQVSGHVTTSSWSFPVFLKANRTRPERRMPVNRHEMRGEKFQISFSEDVSDKNLN